MKTKLTIFLILISLCGYSQEFFLLEKISYDTIWKSKSLNSILIKDNNLQIDGNVELDTIFQDVKYIRFSSSIGWILTYYDIYQKECYNDSTLTEIETTINPNHIIDLGNGLTGSTLLGYSRTFENVYKHKQPTFTDFMNWINKQ